jgi:hypothetical protein
VVPHQGVSANDELWAELGANIFLGKHESTMFGMLDENDNVYLTLRYAF